MELDTLYGLVFVFSVLSKKKYEKNRVGKSIKKENASSSCKSDVMFVHIVQVNTTSELHLGEVL